MIAEPIFRRTKRARLITVTISNVLMIHETVATRSTWRGEIILYVYYNYSAQSATVLPPRGRAPSNAAVKSDVSRQPLRTSGYAPCRVRLADPRREYLVMFTRPA